MYVVAINRLIIFSGEMVDAIKIVFESCIVKNTMFGLRNVQYMCLDTFLSIKYINLTCWFLEYDWNPFH